MIAAGGRGSRMSPARNPAGNKSLIEYRGRPLIHYLLCAACDAGFEEILISTNELCREPIERAALAVSNKCTVACSEREFAYTPFVFRSYLEDQIALACGHHPVPAAHLYSLRSAAESYDAVTTAYQDPPFPTNKRQRILVHNVNNGKPLSFQLADLDKETISYPYHYAQNPYVITRAMVDAVAENNFRLTAGFFVYKHWKDGGAVAAVPAIMPPEFDYDYEFERLLQLLDKRPELIA